MSDLVTRVINQLRDAQRSEVESALMMKLDYEKYLAACGRYQGRQEALEMLSGLLDAEDEKEERDDGAG